MGLLESKLQKLNAQKRDIERHVQSESVQPTIEEKQNVDTIVRKISDEHFTAISENGVSASTEQLINAAEEEIAKLEGSYEEKKRIEKIVKSNIMGLGPIEDFMHDPDITEIMVLRYDHIVIEKDGKKINTTAKFTDEQHLQTIIQRIVQPIGRQITLSTPIVDARLPDGSRVNATIPPVSVDGATLTIRRFSNKALMGEDYVRLGTMNEAMLEFLEKCVKGKANIMVSGGTNTGKTTLLNMLSRAIPREEMIVTIEDSCELQLNSPNVRRLEAREITGISDRMMPIDIKALVKNSLRMNPDRIIVGEIRDGTIVDMISAMSTGHEGSMSTAHANSPANLVNTRIPIFYSMAEANFSEETQALQIAEAIDLIVQISFREGKRVITNITALTGVDKNKVMLRDIFVYDKKFRATGYIPDRLLKKLKRNDVEIDMSIFSREVKQNG